MSRKSQQKVYPWSAGQFHNQSFSSSTQSAHVANPRQGKVVSSYAESNQFTRKAQFSNLFDVYETEIARLENHVFQLVHEINNLQQNNCLEQANYDKKLLMHAKLNERLFQENQDILRMNEQLLSENKFLRFILEEKKCTPGVSVKQENCSDFFDSQMEEDEVRPGKSSTGLDQLNGLINDLKNETKNSPSRVIKSEQIVNEVPAINLSTEVVRPLIFANCSSASKSTFQISKSFSGVPSKRSVDKKKAFVKKRSVYRKLFNLK